MPATTIPARIANMVPGTVPVGTRLAGFGTVEAVSLTAYKVASGRGPAAWLPFVHVHNYAAATPLVVLG